MSMIQLATPRRRVGVKSKAMKAKVQRFSVAYDGPALQTGGMDILELAPAMMAIGQLLQSANTHANGDRAKLDVKVFPLREGSMMLVLGSSVTLATAAKALIGGVTLTNAHELYKVVFGKMGLLEVLKWLRGRSAQATAKPDEKGNVTVSITNSPGAVVVVNPIVAAMVKDAGDRRLAAAVVRPLRRAGVDQFKRIEGTRETDVATKDDLPAFVDPAEVAEAEAASSVSETETTLVPRNHPMYRGPKWRVRFQGQDVDFYVTIADEAWLKRHDGGEVDLRPGDGLRVKLKTRTFLDEDGEPAAQYFVIEVLGVVKGLRGEQTSLGE